MGGGLFLNDPSNTPRLVRVGRIDVRGGRAGALQGLRQASRKAGAQAFAPNERESVRQAPSRDVVRLDMTAHQVVLNAR